MENKEKNDHLFRLLCADALRSKGEYFPQTDEEIDAFMKRYQPTEEEKKHFKEIKDKVIQKTLEDTESLGDKIECDERSLSQRLSDLQVYRQSGQYRMASAFRKPKDKEISKELDDKINKAIEGEENKRMSNDDGK